MKKYNYILLSSSIIIGFTIILKILSHYFNFHYNTPFWSIEILGILLCLFIIPTKISNRKYYWILFGYIYIPIIIMFGNSIFTIKFLKLLTSPLSLGVLLLTKSLHSLICLLALNYEKRKTNKLFIISGLSLISINLILLIIGILMRNIIIIPTTFLVISLIIEIISIQKQNISNSFDK